MESLYSLPCKWRVWLVTLLMMGSFGAYSQIGYIYDPATGTTVLDPNGDSYISATGTAIDTSVVLDESYNFEYPFIPMFHLSIEPPADLLTGNDCGKSEIVDNPKLPMHAGYWYLADPNGMPGDGDEALIYRMRIARNVNGAYGFSFLIDTDNKIGFTGANADPNAVTGNPGFELEIIYGTAGSGTVSIMDVDGTTSGTTMSSYSGTTNSQRSHAGFTNCPLSDPVFLDFFVPWDSLGILPTDTVRMIFATSSSANSALGGSASDIGGINDNLYGDPDSSFVAITDSTPSFTFGGCGWAITQVGQQVSCYGDTDGWAWVDVWGGAPPVSYLWSTGSTADTVYNLGAGVYEIYVTSGGGCMDTVTVEVTQPDSLVAQVDILDSILCYGDFNGRLGGYATGGTPPYTGTWSNGAITDTISNLGQGYYTYYVTDANGCTDSIVVDMMNPLQPLVVQVQNQNEILCYGDSIGSIDLLITGGTPPYSLLWNDGYTDSARVNMVAGTYSVIVTDAHGCTDSLEMELTQPAMPVGGLTIAEAPVSCFGGSDGVGVVVATGGRSPYTYEWSNGETTDTASALSAGSQWVVVTDSVGCTDTLNVTILQPDSALAVSAVMTSAVNCFGGTDGVATASVNGGTVPYSYVWNTGDTTSSITVAAGTYTVVVTDFMGCSDSSTVTITQPVAALNVAIVDSADVMCFGDDNGFATATASGGTAPYDYEWSNGITDSSATGLAGGTYTIIVTDANGCVDSAKVTIAAPTAVLAVSETVIQDLMCNGDVNGSGYIDISGGTAPYSILWNTGSTNDTIENLGGGTYTVVVTDANGCTDSASFTLVEPTAMNIGSTVDANVLCFGGNDGAATVTVTGGTSPYTYAWSAGQTTSVVTDLTAGTHTVVVTDANGCTDSVNITISEPAADLVAGTTSNIGVTCKGDVDGSATASASGGTPPYSYSWSNGMTGQNISGLPGGTYILTVTDANGCQDTTHVLIFEPEFELLVGAADGTTITCNGASDGTAYASASGGVPPYTFSWSNGMTGDTITGIPAGSYVVTVTDSMGCQDTNTVVVTEPPLLDLNVTYTDVTCFGQTDGTANSAPSGGEMPYTYLWSTGSTASSISGLTAGTYTVTVTDNRGCTVTDTVTITAPTMPLAAIISKTDVNCFGGSDGTAEAIGSGGVSPYTYLWNDGQTGQVATGLAPGAYYVIMTDANGCQDSAYTVIDQPLSALSLTSGVSSAPTCAGFLNGEAFVTASGGTAPYTYAWSSGSTNDTATGLGGGNVIVTVTDSNGCVAVDTINVPSPSTDLVVAATIVNDALCNGSADGFAYGIATGGTAPYSISWSTGATTDTVSGLSAGTYTVFVVDSLGCSSSATFTISEPDTIAISVVVDANVSCFGGADGAATASAIGGTSPYTFAWSDGQTTASATGLSAGTYSVTVTDSNGCSNLANVTITEPATAVSASASMTTAVSCFGGSDGVAQASASGGTAPYTYLWDNGQTTATASGLTAGSYVVTVTDSLGCTDTASVVITEPASAVDVASVSIRGVTCLGNTDGWATVAGSGGTSPYTYSWSNGQTGDSAYGLPAGTYTVTITDNLGCQDTLSVVIPQPAAALSASAVDAMTISCFGASDGTAYATASGGWAPYTYSWSTGATTDTITGLAIGTYTVTVTDSLGCQTTANVTLVQPTAVAGSTVVVSPVSCFGGSDGSAYVVGSGGTSPYTYAWANGETNDTAIALTAGTHNVIITDANGCQATVSVTITQPATAVGSSATVLAQVLCFGDSSASARASGTGGVPPYTYSWSNGQTSRTATGLWAGTHTAIVTDARGCTDSVTVTITQPATAVNPTAVMTQQVSCYGGNDGRASASASGGTAPYTYLWSNGVSGSTTFNLPAGWHYVTVTDANGCSDTARVLIIQPSAPVSITGTVVNNVTCFGGSDGSAWANVTGGTAPYTYSWSDGQTTDTAVGLVAGNYAVLVTDSLGCQDLVSVIITQPATDIMASAYPDLPTSCYGGADGTAYVVVTNGVAPFTYLWADGQTSDTAIGLASGSISVTVTDALGCVATATVVVASPPQDLILTPTVISPVSCIGGGDGSAFVFVQGGTSPYTYAWSNGETAATAVALTAGTHSVVVTDALGCMDTTTVTVTEPTSSVTASATVLFAVNCFGGNDGWATATATGGTPPYTYSWDNGQTGYTASNLDTGLYVVTVTDANGCWDTASVVMTQPDSAVEISVDILNNVRCLGGFDGAALASATGGTAPYSFDWDHGTSTDLASNLLPGKYTVTVTDANGCQDSMSVWITEPATALVLTSAQVSPVNCFGGADGIAYASATGGDGPYTFTWSNGHVGDTAYGLTAGTYAVTLADSNGCTTSGSVTISQPASAVSVTASVLSNVNCFGGADGSANASASGGTPPYTYAWSSGSTTSTASSLSAGTYTVVITDANGCSDSANVAITEPAAALTSTQTIISHVLCFAGNDGEAYVTYAGGTAPYVVIWSNGAMTDTISNLTAGTYTASITDANGCVTTQSVVITQPSSPVNLSAVVNSNVNCFGGTGGSATASGSGGTAPLTYTWSNGATGASISGLAAGTYTVTLTDANGCWAVDSVTITQPAAALSVTLASQQNVNCFGDATGSADVNVTGGTSPYTYSWSNGATAATISNLTAGSYTVTVTDANGCTDTLTVIITEPSSGLGSLASVIQNVNCFGGNDGSAYVEYTGGTAPYTIAWNTGSSADTIANLTAGTYTVTITDANGCVANQSVTITEPSNALSVSATVVSHVNCFGDATGEASSTVTGGTAPYSYAWSNGGTSSTITNVVAGIYTVVVTDANGCTDSASVTITQPAAALSVTLASQQNVNCFGDATGSADVNVTGGTSPYTYSWSNGATAATISNLTAGSYIVTVTDANGCTDTLTVNITQPSSGLGSLASVIQNVNCFGGNDGSAYVEYTGGTAPYTIAWNTGSSADTISNLTAGTYTVTITDANGCVANQSVTITEPSNALSVSATVVSHVNCYGDATGEASSTVTGGTAPYNYAWSNGGSSSTITNVVAGTYTVVVTDANGCTDSASVTITQPAAALSVTLASQQNVNCFGDATGSADVNVTGGTSPYTYSWSNGATAATISNLTAGSYTVTVTDANGCTDTLTVNITQPSSGLGSLASVIQNVNCFGGNDGSAYVEYTGGTAPYSVAWNTGSSGDTIANLTAGTYTVTITDANGCISTQSVTITEPSTGLSVSAAVASHVDCFGNATGVANAAVTGGTAPYSYSWSNGTTTAALSNVVAGTYTVMVTDANGCTGTDSVTITQPASALGLVVISQQNVNCFGDATGSAQVSANGGTSPYTYAWSNGASGASVANLASGTYTVTATDANGCNVSSTVIITEPVSALTSAATIVSHVDCFGGANGQAYVTYSGGTAPYTVTWNTGATTDTISNLGAATYTATITDANGCITSQAVVITQPASALTASVAVGSHVSCFGGNNGSVSVTVSGGTMPYTYVWSNGGSTATQSNLVAGTYSVTITDANGCVASGSITVNEPAQALAVSAAMLNAVDCFGASTGSVGSTVTGGTAPYTYSWNNGSTIANPSNLSAGTYTLTVTDANGCTGTATVTVTGPASALVVSAGSSNVGCYNGMDGFASITATGGTAPYTFNWGGGVTGANRTGMAAGTYTCTVTDANGCSSAVSVTITQPTEVVITKTGQSNVNCFGGNDGSAQISVTGGNGPYSISWSQGGSNTYANNLTAGAYTVTAIDANGCMDTVVFNISQPASQLNSAVGVISNVACYDANGGEAYVQVTGGAAPYSISWSNGSTNDTISNVKAGQYTAVITDANGCIDSASVLIAQPSSGITASVTVLQQVMCKGEATGIAYVDITGGTAPYNVSWSNGSGTDTLNQVAAGVYTITVVDANGCTVTQTASITEPTVGLAANAGLLNPVYCYGEAEGAAAVNIVGGTAPYTITWDNGMTGDTINNLPIGVYRVTIFDAAGCSKTDSVMVTGPTQPLDATNNVVKVNCGGAESGRIRVTPLGGTPPYAIAWAHGNVGRDLNNLGVGTYPYTITDGAGCVIRDTVEVTQNPPIESSIDVEFATCQNTADGYIAISTIGGTPPYTYTLDGNEFNGVTNTVKPGIHELTIADSIGCDSTFYVQVGVDEDASYLHIPNAFTPNDDRINESYKIYGSQCIGPSRFQIFDRWGDLVFSSHDPFNVFWDGTRGDGTKVKEDVYVWRFTSADYDIQGHVTVIH